MEKENASKGFEHEHGFEHESGTESLIDLSAFFSQFLRHIFPPPLGSNTCRDYRRRRARRKGIFFIFALL